MSAWPERLTDETGLGISLGDGTGDIILADLPDPIPCTLTFADVFGSPLPPTVQVTITPVIDPIIPPVAGFIGVASALTVNLYPGYRYRAQYFGAFAPPLPTTFIAASAVTLVPARYVSPWANAAGYAGSDVGLGFFWPLGRSSSASLQPGGGVRVLFESFAALLAQLDLFHRTTAAGLRLDSCVGAQIDSWIADFLGTTFPRLPGETDAAYIARAKAWFQTPFGTLAAVATAVAGYFAQFPDGSTRVDVFNRRTDRARSDFYGLLPGQLAIAATYAPTNMLPAWYIGQSYIGQNTYVSRLDNATSSQTPLYAELGRRVNAVKSGVSTPVYIISRH